MESRLALAQARTPASAVDFGGICAMAAFQSRAPRWALSIMVRQAAASLHAGAERSSTGPLGKCRGALFAVAGAGRGPSWALNWVQARIPAAARATTAAATRAILKPPPWVWALARLDR